PAIETEGAQFNPPFCDPDTGANCVNPPAGAKFYPFFTTGIHRGGGTWQEGGHFIPRTVNHFGGGARQAFRPLLRVALPDRGPAVTKVFADFNSGDFGNPCPASGG